MQVRAYKRHHRFSSVKTKRPFLLERLSFPFHAYHVSKSLRRETIEFINYSRTAQIQFPVNAHQVPQKGFTSRILFGEDVALIKHFTFINPIRTSDYGNKTPSPTRNGKISINYLPHETTAVELHESLPVGVYPTQTSDQKKANKCLEA